jgi:hypothetical protein
MYKFLIKREKNLVSPWTFGEYKVTYKPNVWITPKIGMLFYYCTLEEAEMHAWFYRAYVADKELGIEIWKIEVKDSHRITCELTFDPLDWKRFWNNNLYLIQASYSKDPIYCAKKIRLLKLEKKV